MAEERTIAITIKAVLDEFVSGFKEGMATAEKEAASTAAAISGEFAAAGKEISADVGAAAKDMGDSMAEAGKSAGDVAKGTADAAKAAKGDTEDIAKNVEALGKRVSNVGKGMSVALTAPLAIFAKQSVSDFAESARAVADLDAALKSTGNTALKLDDLKNLASELQFDSMADDEAIMNDIMATLVRFGDIGPEAFADATQAALDMSAATGGSFKTNAIALGKALEDPIKSLGGLSKAGIKFTEDQKKMIKTLVETGEKAKAQSIILEEARKRTGGADKAKHDAGGMGELDNFDKAMSELRESTGAILMEVIVPLVQGLREVVDWFRNLSPEAKQFAVAIGGIIAVVGPLLAMFGPLIAVLATVGGGFAALAAPVAIFVAAVAGVSVALNAMGITFEEQWNAIKAALAGAVEFIRLQFQLIGQIFSGDFAGALQTLQDIWTNAWTTMGNIINALFPGLIEKIVGFFTTLGTTVSTKIGEVIQWFTNLKDQVVAIVSEMVSAITDKLVGGLQYAWDAVANGLAKVKNAFKDAYMYIVGGSVVPDMVNEIGAHMETLKGENLVDPAKEATDEVSSLFSGLADTVKSYISDFIKTGKFDIEGFMADISGKLIDWGLDMLFKNLLGGLGGGGGLLGGLFAEGGSPPLNKPSIVGEKGPELFVPKRFGTIVSNRNSEALLGGAANNNQRGRGGNVIQNVSVYARDVDSFKRTETSVGRGLKRQAEIGMRGA